MTPPSSSPGHRLPTRFEYLAASPPTTCRRMSAATRPSTSAARQGSRQPPVNWPWTLASRVARSESNASARPARATALGLRTPRSSPDACRRPPIRQATGDELVPHEQDRHSHTPIDHDPHRRGAIAAIGAGCSGPDDGRSSPAASPLDSVVPSAMSQVPDFEASAEQVDASLAAPANDPAEAVWNYLSGEVDGMFDQSYAALSSESRQDVGSIADWTETAFHARRSSTSGSIPTQPARRQEPPPSSCLAR